MLAIKFVNKENFCKFPFYQALIRQLSNRWRSKHNLFLQTLKETLFTCCASAIKTTLAYVMNFQSGLSILRSSLLCQRCLQFSAREIRGIGTCKLLSQKGNTRDVSTFEAANEVNQDSLVKRVLGKIGLPLNFNKNKLHAAAYFLYEGIVDSIDHFEFFEELKLPDTFYSWFVITELHIWMLSARAMAEGDDGRILRNSLIEALWGDVHQRTKKLGGSNPSGVRMQISELSEQLQAALIAYDEGILADDVVLAGALWRRFYQYGPFEPARLELLVEYVRKQMTYLDSIPKHKFLFESEVEWKPLRVKS